MEWVLTLAIPFCSLFANCESHDAVPLSPAAIQIGQCLDLLPMFPVGGNGVPAPSDGGIFTFPCGAGRAKTFPGAR